MKKLPVIITTAACIMLFAVSCSVDNGSDTNPQQGFFLVANISPDSKPLNVYVNGSPLGSGLSFGIYTPYYSTTAGSYTFSFTDSANNTLLSNTVSIEAQKTYDYYLIDSFSKLKSAFVENDYVLPGTDSVLIRFFNFSPNSAQVTLADAVAGDLFTNRYFNDQAGSPAYVSYTKMPAGIYNLQLKNVYDSVLSTRTDTLSGGHVYSIFAKGFYGGTG